MTKAKEHICDAQETAASQKDESPNPAGKAPVGDVGVDLFAKNADPFGKDVDTSDLFRHEQLSVLQGLAKVSIESKAGMLVTGPAGSGKTTGVRSVTDELPANRYSVVYLGQDQDATNVLRRFAGALGLTAKRYHSHLALQVSQWLLDNLESGGKEVALVVDEAHLLSDQLLEDLRLMMNANYDRKSPLALVLVGQPVLRLRLKSPDFESLSQRLRHRFRLEGLNQDETADYISRRLLAAGLAADIFPPEVIHFLFHVTEGLPRRINNLCSLALLRARAEKRATIDVALLKEIVELD